MEHVGITALEAERLKLLHEYDTAVAQGADDQVKTEHGVSCEAHFRSFLEQYLPRKYGVTKGYIITPNLDYAGPLEEWDIIIYDAMESPVLFVRQNRDEIDSAGRRGIPVEYVRGVVEVKATFNKAMAVKATEKLLRLRQFSKADETSEKSGETYLPSDFRAFCIFFETMVKNRKEFSDALGALTAFWQTEPFFQFSGALIIRGQTCPTFSTSIDLAMSSLKDPANIFHSCCEVSDPVPGCIPEMNVVAVSSGFGPDVFWHFMINMIHALNGEDEDLPGTWPTALTGGYGKRIGSNRNVRLFPTEGKIDY